MGFVLGEFDALVVGEVDGDALRFKLSKLDELAVGEVEGDALGDMLGFELGKFDGLAVGEVLEGDVIYLSAYLHIDIKNKSSI